MPALGINPCLNMKFAKPLIVALLSLPLLTEPAFAERERGRDSGRSAHSAPHKARAARSDNRPNVREVLQRGAKVSQREARTRHEVRREPSRVTQREVRREPRAAVRQSPRQSAQHDSRQAKPQAVQRKHDSRGNHRGRGHDGRKGHDRNDWDQGRKYGDHRHHSRHYGHRGHYASHWRGDIRHYKRHDHHHWRRGYWHRGWHGPRFGWWWVAGPSWYLYSAPVYPYPSPYVPPTVIRETVTVVEQDIEEPDYWYYCENPEGYYPYVQECSEEWFRVPAEPETEGPPPSESSP
jgi:hypothetical protein